MRGHETYNASFDYARLVAVIGIVWFHAKAPGALIGYAGLAYFLLLSVQVCLPQIARARDQAFRAPAVHRYALARAQRLLVPWLVASAFYGGFKVLEVMGGSTFGQEFTLDMILTGTAPHLWYLPFAFLVSVALWPLGRWFAGAPDPQPLVVACFAGALAVLGIITLPAIDVPLPFAQWAYAFPIVVAGVGLFCVSGHVAWMGGFVVTLICAALIADATTGLLEMSLAAGLLMTCHALPSRVTVVSAWCARASLLIFLVHPAFLSIATRGLGIPEASTLLAMTATGLSLGFVVIWETIALPKFLPSPGKA